jgi:hypothetical protein
MGNRIKVGAVIIRNTRRIRVLMSDRNTQFSARPLFTQDDDYLERVPGRDADIRMHLLMRREAGNFMVQSAEDAQFIARKFGYSQNLRVRKIDFIPNSRIPFHLGVSRERLPAQD